MARLVYACRFDVASTTGITTVTDAYRNWIVWHYRNRRRLHNFDFDPWTSEIVGALPAQHSLRSTVQEDSDERAISINWRYPDDIDDGLRWSSVINVGQFGGRCGVEHLISIESVDYNISPARLNFGSPRVIRDICTTTPAYIGEMQVRAIPYKLDQGFLRNFLELLISALRKLPIVLLSPFARGEPNRLDAEKLARNLAGVAVIVVAEDPETTWDFTEEVGRQLSCFNGGARIYWPGFTLSSHPRNHGLFLSTWIDDIGPETARKIIEDSIFAVAAFRYVPDSRISDLIRRVESAARHKNFEEKRGTADDFWADYERDLKRLEEAERHIDELKTENANLKANQEVFFRITPATDNPAIGHNTESQSNFSTVLDAVTAAKNLPKLKGKVEILDSALAAAAECPFQRPLEVYSALVDLGDIAEAWTKNRAESGSGGDLLQHLRDKGWGKRSSLHISNTTRGKYQSHYEFEYRGEKQLFEPHITIGAGDANSCASIHFIFEQRQEKGEIIGKVIVAHAGKHLPNTKT